MLARFVAAISTIQNWATELLGLDFCFPSVSRAAAPAMDTSLIAKGSRFSAGRGTSMN
jgi:hypothetical protein